MTRGDPKLLDEGGQRSTAVDATCHPTRLALVVSHPIQYFAHLYRCLSAEAGIELRVFFCSNIGARTYYDKDMRKELKWATDLLSGYDHVFLTESSKIHDTGFLSINNPSIAGALRSFSPDVVLLHGYSQMTMLRALFWCRINGVPALVSGDSTLGPHRSWLRRIVKRLTIPLLFRQYSGFLALGPNSIEYFKDYGVPAGEIFLSPYTIDEPNFKPVRDAREDRRTSSRMKFGISQDSVVFLFVGKLIQRKRPLDIIDAVAALLKEAPALSKIRAVFAGDGALRASLEERTRSIGLPCRFLGFVNVDKLPEVYSAADVLVHPAEVEAYGIVLFEAAFVGLPLVASDRVGAVGPTNVARARENAIVYPCGDVGALADAMERLAQDPELRERMGQASLRIAAELDVRRSVRGVLDAVSFVTGRNVASA